MPLQRQRFFRTEFYEEVRAFMRSIDLKAADKILWNIDLAEQTNDPRLFKKLADDIWEFRTKYQNLHAIPAACVLGQHPIGRYISIGNPWHSKKDRQNAVKGN